MSSPAVANPRRSLTRGYSEIPNSLIENQSAFTHAEMALTLIVLRRGGIGDTTVTVSDRNWQGWTGLSPRQKEYAIAGLKAKCLNVSGRGEDAGFSFRADTWERFVRSADRSKPRTAGRKPGVSPKPGAKIHSDCRERGCALLAKESAEVGAQPVAHSSLVKTVTLAAASRITQPVAQMADAAELAWSKTLTALRSVFPLIGVAFMLRLLEVVRSKFAEVQDSQLAEAVTVAWQEKQRFQKGEGLFLLTVPEALAAILKRPVSPPAPDISAGVERLLIRCVESLRARGAPFEQQLEAVSGLLSRVQAGADLMEIEREMEWIDSEIIDKAQQVIEPAQRASIASYVESNLGSYRGRMEPRQLKALSARMFANQTLKTLDIPRLSLFCV